MVVNYGHIVRIYTLIHWGWVTHICVGNPAIIVSDNGLSPGRRQTIIWTNTGILSIGPLGTNFNEILIEIQIFSSKKTHLKMSPGKRRLFCLGLDVLTHLRRVTHVYRSVHWPTLFQIMAGRLVGAQPLSQSMLTYSQMDSWEQISVKFGSKYTYPLVSKWIWKYNLLFWFVPSLCQPNIYLRPFDVWTPEGAPVYPPTWRILRVV